MLFFLSQFCFPLEFFHQLYLSPLHFMFHFSFFILPSWSVLCLCLIALSVVCVCCHVPYCLLLSFWPLFNIHPLCIYILFSFFPSGFTFLTFSTTISCVYVAFFITLKTPLFVFCFHSSIIFFLSCLICVFVFHLIFF